MHVADHLSLDQLQARADGEAGKTRFLRLRAVILALQGRTAPEVAAAAGGPASWTPPNSSGSACGSTPARPRTTGPAPSAGPRSAPCSGANPA